MVDNKTGCANRPSGAIPEGSWTHLAVVVDRTNAKTRYYFNGAQDSAQDIPAKFAGSLDVEGGDLSIGSSWQPFIGLLDDVRIYRRALSAEEVSARYDQEKARYTSAAYELVE